MQGVIQPAHLEIVGEAEQQEAWFNHLAQEHDGCKQAEVYRQHYLKWLQEPMTAHAAYLQRACMGLQAKCYLQAGPVARAHTLAHAECICLQKSTLLMSFVVVDMHEIIGYGRMQARWDCRKAIHLLLPQLKVCSCSCSETCFS